LTPISGSYTMARADEPHDLGRDELMRVLDKIAPLAKA
jgi:hypothetical protein